MTGPPRSLALDALRGGAVALMILVNNPGHWSHLFSPLATLALLVQWLDLRQRQGAPASLMLAFGHNALFTFFLSGLLPRALGLLRWRDGAEWTSLRRWRR